MVLGIVEDLVGRELCIAQVLRTEDPTVLMDGMQSFAQLSSVGPEWKFDLLVKGTSKLVQGGKFLMF